MRAFVVVEVDVQDANTYEAYKAMAPQAIAAYGGKYLVRGAKCTTLEGSWDPKRFVILEFPSADKALRHKSATTEMILVEGPSFDPADQD